MNVDKYFLFKNRFYDIIKLNLWFVNPLILSMASPFNIFGIGSNPKSYLGIDIGTLSIKIVELSNENGRPKLKNYGILTNYGWERKVPWKVARFRNRKKLLAAKQL